MSEEDRPEWNLSKAKEHRPEWKLSKTAIGKEFNRELANEIIRRMEACENLTDICRDAHMPKIRAIASWRKKNPQFNEEFLRAYHSGRGIISPRSGGSGRVTIRTKEIEDEILNRLEDGEILAQIARLEHLPRQSTIYEWMAIDPDFSRRVARARELGAATIQAECIDIADDGSNDYYEKTARNGETYTALDSENIQRSKLRIETRKWIVGTINPSLRDSPNVKINVHTPEVGSINIGSEPEATTTETAYEEYQRLIKGE